MLTEATPTIIKIANAIVKVDIMKSKNLKKTYNLSISMENNFNDI